MKSHDCEEGLLFKVMFKEEHGCVETWQWKATPIEGDVGWIHLCYQSVLRSCLAHLGLRFIHTST